MRVKASRRFILPFSNDSSLVRTPSICEARRTVDLDREIGRYSRNDVANGVFHSIDATNQDGELVVGHSIAIVRVIPRSSHRRFDRDFSRRNDQTSVSSVHREGLSFVPIVFGCIEIFDVHVEVVLLSSHISSEATLFSIAEDAITIGIVTGEDRFDLGIGVATRLQISTPFVELQTRIQFHSISPAVHSLR